MKRITALLLSHAIAFSLAFSQTPSRPQNPTQPGESDDVIRITTALVQTDVVVTDKNDQVVPDLKLDDFEVYENGKKQAVKFMEFVGTDTGRRTEGTRPSAVPSSSDFAREPGAADMKRVFAFVIDDLTVPFQDLVYVRQALTDFVDNRMQEGDLVAIVRTVGGKGLLQQFTSDKQLLRRAIAQLNVVTSPFQAYDNPSESTATNPRQPSRADGTGTPEALEMDAGTTEEVGGAQDENIRLSRGLITLQTTNYLIDSLKRIPGQKSLVLVCGGIPIFETTSTGTAYSSVSYVLNQLADNALRSGVVIHTLDPRGLRASPGVASFADTPGKGGLDAGGPNPNFITGGTALSMPLVGGSEHLSLNTLSSATGGISIANVNNLKGGLDRILSRSRGYYLLAYTPEDKFDNKFRKLQIKVKRDGVRVYSHSGYLAKEDRAPEARTKEQTMLEAAKSPLAKRDVDLAANVGYKLATANKATLDINLQIEAAKLNFTQAADGKQQASFDVAGFLYDQYGKLRGGFSETVNTNLSAPDYQRALKEGLTYSANTEAPSGYYQFRAVVRDASTGKMGTVSRYLEIPNLSNGKLAMSTLYLFTVNAPGKGGNAEQVPISGVRQVSHSQDLRYAAAIYNAKREGNKIGIRTQTIISQGGNILLKEPEEEVNATDPAKVLKIGQFGVSRVRPGRYILTLIVTDPYADKKYRTISRSIDFVVTN
jgi:VWFA-related protein